MSSVIIHKVFTFDRPRESQHSSTIFDHLLGSAIRSNVPDLPHNRATLHILQTLVPYFPCCRRMPKIEQPTSQQSSPDQTQSFSTRRRHPLHLFHEVALVYWPTLPYLCIPEVAETCQVKWRNKPLAHVLHRKQTLSGAASIVSDTSPRSFDHNIGTFNSFLFRHRQLFTQSTHNTKTRQDDYKHGRNTTRNHSLVSDNQYAWRKGYEQPLRRRVMTQSDIG